MNKVCFIILHYGEKSIIENCINMLLKLDNNNSISILIVDNNTDKTMNEREKIKINYEKNKKIEFYFLNKTTGFSRANNLGYKLVREKYNPDYIVLMNNDIMIKQSDFIKKINDSYTKYHYMILSPDIISQRNGMHQSPIDNKIRTKFQINCTIIINFIFLKLYFLLYPLLIYYFEKDRHGKVIDKNIRMENVVPCGACFIVSKDFIENNDKIFYPETNFYYEEYILHYQCKQKEYLIIYDPDIKVFHGDGIATQMRLQDKKKKIKFILRNTLNSAKVYKKLMK